MNPDDDECYDDECSNCDTVLSKDIHIFNFTRGDEETGWMCQTCGEDLAEELRAEGWKRDDDEEDDDDSSEKNEN